MKAFLSRLDRFLSSNLEDIAANLAVGGTAGIDAASILGGLQESLVDAGLTRELGQLQAIYADELSFIREELEDLGVTRVFSDIDLDTIEALVNFDVEQVTGQVRGYVDDVRSVLMRNVLGGETPDFRSLRDTLGTRLVSNLDTEINTALMAFNRAVTANKAKDLGFELFIYLGPDDNVTRPFCESVLADDPAIYTIEEIQGMDNDQGLPVLEYGGGYNCRHHWRPVSEERARELGWRP